MQVEPSYPTAAFRKFSHINSAYMVIFCSLFIYILECILPFLGGGFWCKLQQFNLWFPKLDLPHTLTQSHPFGLTTKDFNMVWAWLSTLVGDDSISQCYVIPNARYKGRLFFIVKEGTSGFRRTLRQRMYVFKFLLKQILLCSRFLRMLWCTWSTHRGLLFFGFF